MPTQTHRLAPTNYPHGREMSTNPSPHNPVALKGREASVNTMMTAQDELTSKTISTQDTLKSLFGVQQMMDVSDGWLARDELARMEQTLQIPPQPLAEPPAPWTHLS